MRKYLYLKSRRLPNLPVLVSLVFTHGIPAAADFPSISYVTHQEIEQEWEQVSTAEALSEDDEFADDRKKLVTCLDEARKQKLGLVGFYY